MKKILQKTLLAIVCLLCANCIVQAQSVRFFSRGIEYENEATVTANKYDADFMNWYWETQLKNFSDKEVNFTLRVEPLENRHSDDFLTLATPTVCISLSNGNPYECDITLAAGESTGTYVTEMSVFMGYTDSYAKIKFQIINKEEPNDNTTLYVILDANAPKNPSVDVDGIYYMITSPTDVEITGSSTNFSSLVIPETVEIENVTYNVTSIGDNAFLNHSELVSVTIPYTVKEIGENAFSGCGLQEIHCNATTPPHIYSSTFGYMEDAIILYVPLESVEAYRTASYWSSFYNINKYLVDGIYYDILSDTEVAVVYPAINPYSGEIVIPERVVIEGSEYNVTSIGEYAFYNFTELTKITIPNSVTSIGQYAFVMCTGLKVLIIADGDSELNADISYLFYESPIETLYLGRNTPNCYFENHRSLTSVTIGNSVTSIGESAFSNCTKLTSITIGNSVKSIGNQAFKDCVNLTEITIPNSVTSISDCAFYNCTGLTSVTIPNSVTSIGKGVFYECTGLTEFTIPNSVTSIGVGAFYRCTGLTEITIPNSVTSISDKAFSHCTGLTEITIPESLTSMGVNPFYECTNLAKVIWNAIDCETYKTDHEEVSPPFYLCGVSEFILGDKVKTISDGLCYGMDITSIIIPQSVTSIGISAFRECTELTSITIPQSVTSIGYGAFGYCSGLTEVAIPNSVTSIGDCAFCYCSGLTSVTIGNSVTSIGEATFYSCIGLTEVIIPDGVISIGVGAFAGCSGLTEVAIPNSVTLIDEYAFNWCTGLSEVIIPNNVTSIGYGAFAGCTGLRSVTVGSGVQEMGDYVFDGCDRIKDVYSYPTIPPTIYGNTFNAYVNDNATLHVPEECKYVYESANYWKYFANILEDIKYTAVESITTDATNVSIEYYDLNGRRVARPEKGSGIYIVKQGNAVRKVVL